MHIPVTVAFTFVACSALAQSPFEYADQRTRGVWYIGCARAANTWVACGSAGSEGVWGTARFAQAFHLDGTLAWQTDLIGPTMPMVPSDMMPMPGGGVLVVGPHDGCDVGLPTSLLMELDGQGGVAWAKDIWLENANSVDVAPDGRILVSTYQKALITDQQGDSLTLLNLDSLGQPSVKQMQWADDSTLLLIRFGGVVERRSLQAQLLSVIAPPISNLQDIVNWAGHRLVIEPLGTLHVLDDDLQLVSTIPLGGIFEQGRFVHGDSTLWVIGNAVAVELDSALTILRSVELDPNDIFDDQAFRGFAVDGDTIAMAGAAGTAQRPAGLIRTVVADGMMADHDEDISITIESIDSTWYQLSGSFVYPRADVTVRVTNEGGGVVNDLVVDHHAFDWICEAVGKTLHLSGLNLAPGGSVTAVMDSLWLNYAPWGWLQLDQQICIAAMSPNNIYDRDQSDNLACDTVHIVLGMADIPASAPFTLITDPLNDRVVIQFHSPITRILQVKVLDMSGRLHDLATLTPGQSNYSLNTGGLASGIYAVDVMDALAGRWSAKWVKE